MFLYCLCFFYSGRQKVLVHQQTGIAAITATALGYQVSHVTAAKVPTPVSESSLSFIMQV